MSRDTFPEHVPRAVQERPSPENQEARPARGPFQDFFEHEAIVLLGDPGMGKTVLFQTMAAEEEGGEYATVRDFFDFSLDRFRDRILYLDGLDEVRGGASDVEEVTGRLRRRLNELGLPKFRLSCRPADWFGSHDLSLLSAVSASRELRTLHLEPLTDEDVQALAEQKLEDASDFLANARAHGLEELLYNPLTLLLLLGVVRAGSWPESRKEVYERGLHLLAQEKNRAHERAPAGRIATAEVLQAAGWLCALHILAGLDGFALARDAERHDGVPYRWDLSNVPDEVSRPLLDVALRRRLFTVTNERAEPVHRTVAEFLGAQHLVERVQKGLPLTRALALLQGGDGGIVSDRRGLFAWLVTLAPAHASTLIPLDPLAVVLYGDPASLPDSSKLEIVEALRKLSEVDPYFLADLWWGDPFGTLSSPGVRRRFLEIIEDPAASPHLVSLSLDGLTFSRPAPEVGDRLMGVIRDDTRPEELRSEALKSFLHNCRGQFQPLRSLLDDISRDNVTDPRRVLRGQLLLALFPRHVRPSALPSYLAVDAPDDSHAGEYKTFLFRDDLPQVSEEQNADLLDSLASSELCKEIPPMPGFGFRGFLGQVLVRGVKRSGDAIAEGRLLRWLQIPLSAGRNVLASRDKEEVKKWFEARPELVARLYSDFMAQAQPGNFAQKNDLFWRELVLSDPPPGFGHQLLTMAAEEPIDERARFFFSRAWMLALQEQRQGEPTVDTFWEEATRRPLLRVRLEKLASWALEERRFAYHRRRAQHEEEKKEALEQTRLDLHERLDGIRAGSDWGALSHLSNVRKGRTSLADQHLPEDSRISRLYGKEISAAALTGFEQAITEQGQPSPSEIGQTEASGSHYYHFARVVLEGLELVWGRAPEDVLALPGSALQRAVVYRLHYTDGSVEHPWLRPVAESRPDLVADAVTSYWQPLLMARERVIEGLHLLRRADGLERVASTLAKEVLQEFPRPHTEILRQLLLPALAAKDRAWLRVMAVNELDKHHGLSSEQFLLWLTTAYLLDPESFANKFVRHASQSVEKAHIIASFVSELYAGKHQPPEERAESPARVPEVVFHLLTGLGSVCSPPDLRPPSGVVPKQSSVARIFSGLLDTLAAAPSPFAGECLQRLRDMRRLRPWRDRLAHALHEHLRARREAEFRAPNYQEVALTLANSTPSNPRDLLALLVDHLTTVERELRHGAEDDWVLFWNTDQHGRAQQPKVEDRCRDVVKRILRQRLDPLQVHLETESRHAEERRADFRAMMFRDSVPVHLPIEAKRHMNRDELWTAIEGQLIPRYTRDPHSGGYGLYLVFWFGEGEGRVPPPPAGIERPTTVTELEQALKHTIPVDHRDRIAVVCLDLSPPPREEG